MTTSEQAITIVRILDASPEALYAAWTDPQLMQRWMGTRVKADVRVGPTGTSSPVDERPPVRRGARRAPVVGDGTRGGRIARSRRRARRGDGVAVKRRALPSATPPSHAGQRHHRAPHPRSA
ncbi:SRPBCC family protein [Chondromyces apiculatus]|uniref:SRPBCC family protein n=1 Tax=Chondromyces apiculatus TaxID=51 RepID=UPI0009DDD3D5